VNKPWIRLIPELKALFDETKHTQKAIAWERNTYAKKLLSYIYFTLDFTSPLRDWEEGPRHEEALKYTDLTETDVKKPKVKAALEVYEHLQIEACRAIKTYRASLKGLTAMDEYLKSVDFNGRDKQGKLLYTPNQYVANLALTDKAYDALERLANRVTVQLEQNTGIRGKAPMGDSEIKAASSHTDTPLEITPWDETVIAPDGRTQWTEITGLVENFRKNKSDVA